MKISNPVAFFRMLTEFFLQAISLHTFFVLFFRWSPPSSPFLAFVTIGLIWFIIVLDIVIGNATHEHYFGQNGHWCWINDKYHAEEIASEYLWMWFTALLNVFLYVLLFFCLRGNIVVMGSRIRWRWIGAGETWVFPDIALHHAAIARRMLW